MLLTDGLELSTLLEGETLVVSNTAAALSIHDIRLASIGIDTPGSTSLAQPITGVLIPASVIIPDATNATTNVPTTAPMEAPVEVPVGEPVDTSVDAPVDEPVSAPETSSSIIASVFDCAPLIVLW